MHRPPQVWEATGVATENTYTIVNGVARTCPPYRRQLYHEEVHGPPPSNPPCLCFFITNMHAHISTPTHASEWRTVIPLAPPKTVAACVESDRGDEYEIDASRGNAVRHGGGFDLGRLGDLPLV